MIVWLGLYVSGFTIAFILSAYVRALNWRVPRWSFVAWPLFVLYSPLCALFVEAADGSSRLDARRWATFPRWASANPRTAGSSF